MPLRFSLQRSAFDLLLLFLNLKSLYIFRQFQLLQYQDRASCIANLNGGANFSSPFDLIAFCCTTCYSLNNWRRHGRIRIRWRLERCWRTFCTAGVFATAVNVSFAPASPGNGNCKCPCPISSTCTYHGTSCISDLNRGIGIGSFNFVTAVELPVTPVIVGAVTVASSAGVWNVVGVLSVPLAFFLRRLTFHWHPLHPVNAPRPISSTCTYHGTSRISDLNRGIGIGSSFNFVTCC